MAVAFDRQQSVPRQVYDLLREKILSVELEPGVSINERWLADWLGVSRTPIREAIKRLSDNGLISIVPNVGTSVALINLRKVQELCLIRASLESAAIRVAAERYTARTGGALRDLIDSQAATIAERDLNRNLAIDNEFHRTIVELAGFTTVWNILQNVMGEILRVRHLSVRVPRRLEGPIEEHRAIVAALETGSPDKSEAALKFHLSESLKSIMNALDEHPDYLEKVPDGVLPPAR